MKTWAGVSGVMFAVFVWVCSAQAQYVSEDFKGSTASDWTFVKAAGDGAVLTGNGTLDPEGDGWLRLTSDKTNQGSFVYYNNPIQTSKGLVFTFDFVVWSAKNSIGDGFALVIFDAEASPVATGGWGGSLGYAQHVNNGGLGLNGGIVGFGFDTFGNYSNPTEGRIGGPGSRENAIAIRGSMGATRSQGYAYVTGAENLDRFATGNAASRDTAVVHSVRLTITPDKLVSIEWKAEGEEWETLLDSYACTLTCPSQVKFGFSASTGGAYSNHEIRNVKVNPYAQRLPDTGQTKCYDNTVEITCPQPGEDFYGQDAEYVKTRSYTDLGDGTVRDNVTGLEWVQDGNLITARDPGFDTDGTAGDGVVTWQHALGYVALLNADEYLGHDDWRLPTIKELTSLVDSSLYNPAIDPVFSSVVVGYWSSTTFAGNTSNAWNANFTSGAIYNNVNKADGNYVRAVRGNPLPSNSFIDNNDGTITDTGTGLMWQQDTAPAPANTWEQALDYVAGMNAGTYENYGYTDWRLPDRNELQSIAEYSLYNPAIDPLFSTELAGYWSSTTKAEGASFAWNVNFISGGIYHNVDKASNNYVRAVRGGQYVLLGDLGDLCIEDYHCDEGEECVDGVCEEIPDDPPVLGSGPHVAAAFWPLLSSSQQSPMYLRQNYYVLWFFSDDYASCPAGACTHTAEYSVAGSGNWEDLTVQSDAEGGYAYVELPVTTELTNATTYAFRFAVTDCASQSTQSGEYYFRVATSDAPPAITSPPFVAAGAWPALPSSSTRALVLNQDCAVLWTFSDDYAGCAGLCMHRARFRKVGDTDWTTLAVSTDPDGNWYAYVTLPVESLDAGTYQFYFDVRDCAGQRTSAPKVYYFKVE